jgi:hypothetical protein
MPLPSSPYRGLLYYESDWADIFAGRSEDSKNCAERLMGAPLLILHGRTGCGKSSFLRAGLAPFLEASSYPASFMRDEKGFKVVRSGALPLRSLAAEIWRIIEEAAGTSAKFGGLMRDPRSALLDMSREDDFVALVAREPDKIRESISQLGRSFRRPPVIVIDQAEEVFTLDLDPELIKYSIDKDDADRERLAYFSFLRRISEKPPRAKIIVSLRTEYKGQFDDSLAGLGGKLMGEAQSFYLGELGSEGLRAAILRPTLKRGDVEVGRFAVGEKTPYETYGFSFRPEAVDYLVQNLLEASPRGGVLPVLQVTCLELYENSRKKAESRNLKQWSISKTTSIILEVWMTGFTAI